MDRDPSDRDSRAEPDRLFAEFVEESGAGGPVDVEPLCQKHPEHAEAFRALVQHWRDVLASSAAAPGSAPAEAASVSVADDADDGPSAWERFLAQVSARGPTWTRYRSDGELARGGQGVIERVFDQDLRRPLALKRLLPEEPERGADPRASADQALGRFLAEAQITGQLDHPSIVPVHEVGVDSKGRVYFTMKLVRGENLRRVFDRVQLGEQGYTQHRALLVLLAVCEAMRFAHDKGVIHRDLKPANVMVGRYGETYVMDWGLARLLGRPDRRDLRIQPPATTHSVLRTERQELAPDADSPLITMDGHVAGTPCYMPPEQAEGRLADIGPGADIYAVGAMLYEMLTGSPPYQKPGARLSPYTILRWVQDGPPKPIHELAPGAPPELEAIAAKAMARDVKDRYPTMTALAEDLRAFLENRVVRAFATGPTAELRMWVRRNRAFAAACAAFVAIALAGSAFGVLSFREQRDLARAKEGEARLAAAASDAANRAAEERAREALAAKAEAERETARALALRDFLREMLAAAHTDVDKQKVRVVDLLGPALEQAERRFHDRPDLRASLLDSIGSAYKNLDRFGDAGRVLKEAVAIAEESLGLEHAVTLRARNELADLALLLQRPDEALELTGPACEAALGHGEAARERIRARQLAAEAWRRRGEFERQGDILERLRSACAAEFGPSDAATIRTEALANLAAAQRTSGARRAPRAELERVHGALAANAGAGDPDALQVGIELAEARLAEASAAGAEELAAELAALARTRHGAGHPNHLRALAVLARAQEARGDPLRAERNWIAGWNAVEDSESPAPAAGLDFLAGIVRTRVAQGRLSAALPAALLALQEHRRTYGADDERTLEQTAAVAELLLEDGEAERALFYVQDLARAKPEAPGLRARLARLEAAAAERAARGGAR